MVIIFGQLLYPTGQALPYARIADSQVGGKHFSEVAEIVRQTYADVPVTITIPNRPQLSTTTATAGITPGYRAAVGEVTEYSLEARLVPFSFVYKMFRQPSLGYEIDEQKVGEFVKTVQAACAITPKPAAYVVENDRAAISDDIIGQTCGEETIKAALSGLTLRKAGIAFSLTPTNERALVTTATLAPHLSAAQRAIGGGLNVKTETEVFVVPKDTIASWLVLKESELVLDDAKLDPYLASLKGQLYREPGVTKVFYQDGVETGRMIGANGRGVDVDITAERVKTTLFDDSAANVAWVQISTLPPIVQEQRDYSQTDTGLQAMIEQWDRERTPRFGIRVQDLSGKNINAQLNPDMDFVTASTYKMFLAYAVLHKVEMGEMSMDQSTSLGLSVRSCIDEMILHSTNACAHALFDLAGWRSVHDFIRGQFPSTSLDNGANPDGEKHTTIRDETNFLIRLNAGELMNREHTDYLIGLMKRQVYRSGIPRGVQGTTVANKVGFYNGYKHDVAIVYAPRGTYVLGILSYGSNDAQFADLSGRVAQLMR